MRTSSQPRGAKQLVVVTTHATACGVTRAIASATPSTSVPSSSPPRASSITTGVRFAATMALRHVF